MADNSPNQTSENEFSSSTRRRLIPVTEWHKYHSWPKIGGLRHLIFYAKTNGFSHVIRKIGRRVLIDETAFFNWADKHDQDDGDYYA